MPQLLCSILRICETKSNGSDQQAKSSTHELAPTIKLSKIISSKNFAHKNSKLSQLHVVKLEGPKKRVEMGIFQRNVEQK